MSGAMLGPRNRTMQSHHEDHLRLARETPSHAPGVLLQRSISIQAQIIAQVIRITLPNLQAKNTSPPKFGSNSIKIKRDLSGCAAFQA